MFQQKQTVKKMATTSKQWQSTRAKTKQYKSANGNSNKNQWHITFKIKAIQKENDK